MSDGIRLSAKVWLPVISENQPVPAILEFIPYRKRDAYALRDHQNHAWMAAHGYACIRPDMRAMETRRVSCLTNIHLENNKIQLK